MKLAWYVMAAWLVVTLAIIGIDLTKIEGDLRSIEQRQYLDCQVMASDFMRCQSVPATTQVTP